MTRRDRKRRMNTSRVIANIVKIAPMAVKFTIFVVFRIFTVCFTRTRTDGVSSLALLEATNSFLVAKLLSLSLFSSLFLFDTSLRSRPASMVSQSLVSSSKGPSLSSEKSLSILSLHVSLSYLDSSSCWYEAFVLRLLLLLLWVFDDCDNDLNGFRIFWHWDRSGFGRRRRDNDISWAIFDRTILGYRLCLARS